MTKQYDALALLSGGLDSLLAIRVIQDQGMSVLGLHYVSPFFGKPWLLKKWEKEYGITAQPVDISQEYTDMVLDGPANGYGKYLNPCLDCKIMMLSRTRELMAEYGAKIIISGEVIGQRPMSQRRDSLNTIRKQADVDDVLVRPLCAKKMDPSNAERAGLVDREQLLDIGGRGRKPQLELAKKYGFKTIPTPAGGCVLTEKESSVRFAELMRNMDRPTPDDFRLAQLGRQTWSGSHWLIMGRNQNDNVRMEELVRPGDMILKTVGFPGPLTIGRPTRSGAWSPEAVRDAASFAASYASKAVKYTQETGKPIEMTVTCNDVTETISVLPSRVTPMGWAEPSADEFREWRNERYPREL